MDFSYLPIRNSDLRLLTPISIQSNRLSFSMSRFAQNSAPRYTAVSYTWGNETPSEHIFINGQPFPVRLNLWSCLHYLAQDKTAGWTHLWVDAICIDQMNNAERTAQVRRMDTIYRNASAVSVWLGLPPSVEQYRSWHEPIRTFEDSGFDFYDQMSHLANHPYWTRFWVIQEFLLGQDVNVYCGNTRMNWLDFKHTLGSHAGVPGYIHQASMPKDFDSRPWRAFPLITGRHPDRHPETHLPLSQLLINHSTSECKDPRDRVFALLGLVMPDERVLLERFFPDYDMSQDDVVLIALAHVRQYNLKYDGVDDDILFKGLGITDAKKRNMLERRVVYYDYLGGQVPRQYRFSDDDDYHRFPDDDNAVEMEARFSEGDDGPNHSCMKTAYAVTLFVLALLFLGVWKRYR
ncbi:hypothetical protein CUC08_Gglean010174 [Alternaria sp. MG1]|uniref:Heterokaryon incompatibility domain-containing protein n=2 Tax=Alternaria tenuissima TaxID=119927 RepID=A0ABY0FSQ1_9PLEO|nr:hypothetical protein CUC08_Gglean010174 [Alternaria sp. MG1]RYN87224.1 hypothetical protein AA0119_g12543 [Alternaria tenuissima]RYO62988.1 hypothetical protein AA0116_g4151 [Alternaria tenuissima]